MSALEPCVTGRSLWVISVSCKCAVMVAYFQATLPSCENIKIVSYQ